MWRVEVSAEFREWFETLEGEQQAKIMATVEQLEQRGPALPRPLADTLKGSAIHNLKELRPPGTAIRILFVFDPRRVGVLLFGGDKSEHRWTQWYPGAIHQAEVIYQRHLDELRGEGLIR